MQILQITQNQLLKLAAGVRILIGHIRILFVQEASRAMDASS